MKKVIILLWIVLAWSCKSDDTQYETFNIAKPISISKTEFRASVVIQTPQPIHHAGKVYAYGNYIFINDKFEGVHVIDNTNPSLPQAIAYIKIPGNEDISIKNNYLYADSSIDLVVFDISDIHNIEPIERIEDVFSVYDYQFPEGFDYIDFGDYDANSEVIVGWTIVQEEREVGDYGNFETIDVATNDSVGHNTVGTGGSLARFQIVNDYLYTVGSHEMTIFNIANLSQPTLANTFYSGNNVETLFQADGYLYLGSTDGMYIYSLDNAEAPEYVSEFVHWTGCDPVVVDGDYAYLTIRGGNNCGDQDSVLEIIDISNKSNPTLMASHSLENPYGLGINQNVLFVCDGEAGLKVFDKTNPLELQWVETFSNVHATDVIPLENSLLMIGNNILYQYQYSNNSVTLLSTLQL
ncbi:MAG: hypothetical protein R2783_00585 [Gelidibacter sp.]